MALVTDKRRNDQRKLIQCGANAFRLHGRRGYKYRSEQRQSTHSGAHYSRSREMKHLLIGIVAVLSVLPREQLLSSAVGCPRRYLRRINGKCYYFSVKKLNWYGALNNCLRKGLTLADLNNPRDFTGVVDFLSSKGNTEDFWFGANDLQTEGRFQYASNGRLVRYFSNYSLVEPAEHSECDDCLEVRIRSNITVVADDNCLERQYFICSERYCDDEAANKPRHHSHEHLHHFHHDIGEPSEEAEEEFLTESPLDSAPEEGEKDESEAAAIPADMPDETIPDEGERAAPAEVVESTAEGNEGATAEDKAATDTTALADALAAVEATPQAGADQETAAPEAEPAKTGEGDQEGTAAEKPADAADQGAAEAEKPAEKPAEAGDQGAAEAEKPAEAGDQATTEAEKPAE